MSLGNLSQLEAAVAEWLYRTSDTYVAGRAGDFVALFESDFIIDPDMRPTEMEEVDTTNIDGATFDLPDGYLDMTALNVIGGTSGYRDQELTFVSKSRASTLDNTTSTSGVCTNYTIKAGQIVLIPQKWAPIGATLELTYNKFTGLASSSGGTNWMLQKYPNLYLYGSLMQAAAYVDNPEAVAQWKAGRDEAMAKLAKTILKRKVGASPLCVSTSTGFRR